MVGNSVFLSFVTIVEWKEHCALSIDPIVYFIQIRFYQWRIILWLSIAVSIVVFTKGTFPQFEQANQMYTNG